MKHKLMETQNYVRSTFRNAKLYKIYAKVGKSPLLFNTDAKTNSKVFKRYS